MRTLTAPSDHSITQALIDDRDRGFIELVRVHQPGIYSGARRLVRHHQDAEEIAQETFLRAYRALSGYEDERVRDLRVAGWLWTITLNLCRNHGSRSRTATELHERHEPVTRDVESIDDDLWNARLARLPEAQRTAVVLRHVVDLPIADIADITGRPEGTVKADISRGLDRLRRTLEEETL